MFYELKRQEKLERVNLRAESSVEMQVVSSEKHEFAMKRKVLGSNCESNTLHSLPEGILKQDNC